MIPNLLVLALALGVVLVLAVSVWVGLHLHYGRQLDAAQARYDRLRRESGEALGAAQSRLASCRQQLLEAQLEVKRALRLTADSSTPARPAAVESLLMMLDREASEHATANQAFDRTLKLNRSDDERR